MTSTPAGWYPTPEGGQRYWDGTNWLDLPAPDTEPETAPTDVPLLTAPANPALGVSQPSSGKTRGWVGAVVVALLLGGCVYAVNSQGTKSTSNQASLACDHFRNVAGDLGKGILTTAQIRDKAQEIYDNSAIAPAAVQTAAQHLLAAAVADDGAAFLAAESDLDKACTASGS